MVPQVVKHYLTKMVGLSLKGEKSEKCPIILSEREKERERQKKRALF